MPTILDLYSVKPTTNLDGKSLLGEVRAVRRRAISQGRGSSRPGGGRPGRGNRSRRVLFSSPYSGEVRRGARRPNVSSGWEVANPLRPPPSTGEEKSFARSAHDSGRPPLGGDLSPPLRLPYRIFRTRARVPKASIAAPAVIEAAGNKQKRIEECAGRVDSGRAGVSVARMVSPQEWRRKSPGGARSSRRSPSSSRGCCASSTKREARSTCARGSGRGQRAGRMGALQQPRARRRRVRRRLPAGLLAGYGAPGFVVL